MKVFVALLSLVAVANSAVVLSGLPYSGLHPLTYSAPAITYSAPALTYSAPAVHIEPQITTYSVKPVAHEVNYAHPGYVAITPGAKHIAPLPYGGASHHVNLAKAPGTK